MNYCIYTFPKCISSMWNAISLVQDLRVFLLLYCFFFFFCVCVYDLFVDNYQLSHNFFVKTLIDERLWLNIFAISQSKSPQLLYITFWPFFKLRPLLTDHLQRTDHKLEYQIMKKKIRRNFPSFFLSGIYENFLIRKLWLFAKTTET